MGVAHQVATNRVNFCILRRGKESPPPPKTMLLQMLAELSRKAILEESAQGTSGVIKNSSSCAESVDSEGMC